MGGFVLLSQKKFGKLVDFSFGWLVFGLFSFSFLLLPRFFAHLAPLSASSSSLSAVHCVVVVRSVTVCWGSGAWEHLSLNHCPVSLSVIMRASSVPPYCCLRFCRLFVEVLISRSPHSWQKGVARRCNCSFWP